MALGPDNNGSDRFMPRSLWHAGAHARRSGSADGPPAVPRPGHDATGRSTARGDQELAGWADVACEGALPARREMRAERLALLVVQVVALVVDNEIQRRALRQERRLIDDDAAARDLGADRHEGERSTGGDVADGLHVVRQVVVTPRWQRRRTSAASGARPIEKATPRPSRAA